jgi:hypothetical protein
MTKLLDSLPTQVPFFDTELRTVYGLRVLADELQRGGLDMTRPKPPPPEGRGAGQAGGGDGTVTPPPSEEAVAR